MFSESLPTKNTNGFTKFIFLIYVASIYILSFKEKYNIISNALFAFLALLAVMFMIRQNKIRLHKYYIFLVAFVIYSFASCFWAINYDTALTKSVTLILMFGLSFIIYQVFVKESGVDFILKSLMIAGLFMSVYAILFYGSSYFINSMMIGGRLGSEINQANVMGMYAGNTVILCVYYALMKKKMIFLPVALIPAFVCFSSGSRTGLAICILGLLMLIVFLNGTKKIYKGLVASIIIAVVFYQLLQQPIFFSVTSRVNTLINAFTHTGFVDNSAQERFFMINFGFEKFMERPIIGYGADNSRYLVADVLGGWTTYLHNNYVELLVDYGVIGFFLYYFMYISVLFKSVHMLKQKNPEVIIITVLLIVQLISDYGAVTYYSKTSYILLTAGLIITNYGNGKPEHKTLEITEVVNNEQHSNISR